MCFFAQTVVQSNDTEIPIHLSESVNPLSSIAGTCLCGLTLMNSSLVLCSAKNNKETKPSR